ncbi:MAG: HIT domain-containing protein [Gammaproteobacteria bacterium]|nr:HIT domain-containing protein [Gammaproteobacteria bacterium]MCF6258636.1 HIT domain-containing protein [Gammaproteobacteria bacterium]
MTFYIDERLVADSYRLGEFDDCQLLLSKNALFPWFILVPTTRKIEFHKFDPAQQEKIQQHINAVAQFIEKYFSTDKINIASIGNIVSQLHIHIIGRKHNDACWPGVVWGTTHFSDYKTDDVIIIKNQLANALTFFVPD